MIDFRLILRLWLRSFSLKKDSIRRPTFRRIIFVFFTFPIVVLHITITHIFLFFDNIFFPKYKLKNTDKSVFILGFPRSGTSFLLHVLANNKTVFTGFRLWEILFAPSIIQKIFWINTGGLFRKLGLPVERIIQKLDSIFFDKMRHIHDMRLLEYEEDELMFLYLFQCIYFIFMFPELEEIHGIAETDNENNLPKRIKNFKFYNKLIQRHLYVFDKENKKHFLSKNPYYPVKLKALTSVFPNAKYLLIERPPEKSIPSSISLLEHLFEYVCIRKSPNPLRAKTIHFLIEWHYFLHTFKQTSDWDVRYVDFKIFVKKPSAEVKKIHEWLDFPIDKNYDDFLDTQDEFSRNYRSQHQYSTLTESELKQIKKVNIA